MFTHLSLRFRIFLFFCFLAVAGAGLAAAAMVFGWSRAESDVSAAPFLTAFVFFVFLNTGLVVAIWLLFDEHVAKPIKKLSAGLRLQAHSGGEATVSPDTARYLGDLGPAATALTQTMSASVLDRAAQVAQETQRLRVESERLTALLTEIPIATILLNPAHEIVLYDGQAANVLSQIAPPRLKAPLTDYFDIKALAAALDQLSETRTEVPFKLYDNTRRVEFDARLKALGGGGHMVLMDVEAGQNDKIKPRPLVFDFALINAAEAKDIATSPIRNLCYVPFDTETTGLSVEHDAIVQLGAVRVLNGRIVDGEVLNAYVNPGRPIPPSSTRIHNVTDADVADAPDIGEVGRRFHHFARDAVLVAHNAPFDIGLLRASEKQMGVEWTHPVLDTVLLSAVVFGVSEQHSLDALCDRLSINIPPDQRHTALGDARATAEVLVKLLPLLEAKGHRTLGQLIQKTRKHGRLLRDLNG
ncbi:3'-5' exonuclease [Yoonia sp. 2307UL14-13]|uniref:3'-5' exonuclease n=1 Tax=Yoonia sp. 2307UL14-13 TaxID=3126506 RepID=UPI0030956413